MTQQTKIWTHLGLGTAVAVGALGAACAPADTEMPAAEQAQAEVAAPAPDAPVAASDTGVGEGEGGGAGEGEGGVSIAQAATDPVVYISALAITEAHVLAARDAYAAGEMDAAGEMFAHPVSEVLAEMQPVFAQRGVSDFSDLLLEASDAAYGGEPAVRIAEHADAIIAALRAAEGFAPDDGQTNSAVWAGVAADQIDRAADMYAVAMESDAYEPYLDGYGFLKAAQAAYAGHRDAVAQAQPAAAEAIEAAMALLQDAYPSALRPDALTANPAALKAAASRVQLALG
ncbi:MAG: hypothetical protein AAF311_10055 [Pseudomonadota bacterium]